MRTGFAIIAVLVFAVLLFGCVQTGPPAGETATPTVAKKPTATAKTTPVPIVTIKSRPTADPFEKFSENLSASMQQTVYEMLLKPGWCAAPFDTLCSDKKFADPAQKLAACELLNNIIRSIVCSANPQYGLRQALSSVLSASMLPSWVTATSWTGSGVNPVSMCDPISLGSAFDCQAFAKNNPKCTDGLPGCENGAFYVVLNKTILADILKTQAAEEKMYVFVNTTLFARQPSEYCKCHP
jgi:hypothetical protein